MRFNNSITEIPVDRQRTLIWAGYTYLVAWLSCYERTANSLKNVFIPGALAELARIPAACPQLGINGQPDS